MTKVLSLDEAIDAIQIVAKKEKSKPELTRKKPEARKDSTPESNLLKIIHDSKFVLNHYINKFPDIKIIDEQIKTLKEEIIVYKKNKSAANLEKAQVLLFDLVEKRNAVDKIFKRKEYSTKNAEDKAKNLEIIKNDEKIQALFQKQKETKILLKNNTASAIVKRLSMLKTQYLYGEVVRESIQPQVIDFDEFVDDSAEPTLSELEKDYSDLLYYIGTVTGLTQAEIIKLDNNNLLKILKEKLLDTKYINENLTQINMEIAERRQELLTKVSITDILFRTVDYSTEETGRMSKEILASSYVGLVNAIAYNICRSQNKLNELNEAISGGLYGLTQAINKWYVMQSVAEQPLSFENFANLYISEETKKALYNVSGIYGMSGNNKATIDTQNKKKVEEFLKYNPNFKDIDLDIIQDLLANIEPETFTDIDGNTVNNKFKLKASLNVTAESDYNATVGGDEGGVDMYELSDYGQRTDFDFIEAQEQYKKLLSSIDKFLNLFDTKYDKVLDARVKTDRKLFDKYDRKILMMLWGFDHKRVVDPTDSTKTELKVVYDQKERLAEINAMFRANHVSNPRGPGILQISQPALSDREKRLEQKMKAAIEHEPELKAALAYLFSYYRDSDNKAALVQLSNYREELNISLERDELREIYSDNPAQLNKELTDGKRLTDMYELSEENPLDDEIAEMFNEY